MTTGVCWMKDEADESKLRKRMDNLHKDIDIMKGDKFRLTEINLEYIRKELLTTNFMEKHTDFRNFEDMLQSSIFKIENEIEFVDVTETFEWNEYVRENTEFENWKEMLRKSVLERATKKLIK
jgi:hypothetical protein